MLSDVIGTPGAPPDPEQQAGAALERLRKERHWSQEQVARRLNANGFSWHQTTVGRTEQARRHYAEAERLIARLGADAPTEIIKAVAALAQVHATLALAAQAEGSVTSR
jgi:transcriptional regulator with XRE-family HTH domain